MPHKDGEGMGSGTCGQRKVQLGDTCGDVDDSCRRADDGMAEEENGGWWKVRTGRSGDAEFWSDI